MVFICGKFEVIGQVDFDPLPFPDGNRWQDAKKPVKDSKRRLRDASGNALAIGVDWRGVHAKAACGLRQPADDAHGDRDAKNLSPMVVHSIFEAGFANLVQAAELVKAQIVAIGHNEPVKDHGKALLAEGIDAFDLT